MLHDFDPTNCPAWGLLHPQSRVQDLKADASNAADSPLILQSLFSPQRLQLGANSEGSQMSGYLRRRRRGQRWKRAWFVLKDRVLYTYKASEDAVATEALPVLGWSLDKEPSNADWEPGDGAREGLVFKLTHPGSGDVAFCAENMNIAARWIALLADAVTLESD